MRKELYSVISERLLALGDGLIKHVDLWNHNVEFLEQEVCWARPAVFVEFCPVAWKPIVRGASYRAEAMLKLHVVTDWCGSASSDSPLRDETLDVFELSAQIHRALTGASGEGFRRLDLMETQTNHNHEEL